MERLTSWVRGFLVVAAMLLFAVVFLALMRWNIPADNRDAVMIMIGALIARAEKIDNFFFGSSRGSEHKTALMTEADALSGNAGNNQPPARHYDVNVSTGNRYPDVGFGEKADD